MTKLLLIGFLFLLCPHFTQAGPADTVLWSDKPLLWDNFKGNCDTATYHRNYLAISSWKVVYQYRPLLHQGKIEFIIYAWFDTNKSWVRSKNRSSKSLLLHEQSHFDLAELLARQFKQQLSETTFSQTNYADSINRIFSKLLAAAYAKQEKYDAETSHGMNSKRQVLWQVYIASELKKLDDFANKNGMAKLIR